MNKESISSNAHKYLKDIIGQNVKQLAQVLKKKKYSHVFGKIVFQATHTNISKIFTDMQKMPQNVN